MSTHFLRSTDATARRVIALAVALYALAAAVTAHAHVFCVSTSQGLQDALDASSDGGIYNGENNTVGLVRGTYRTGAATGNQAFFFYSSNSAHSIRLEGGFAAGCLSESQNRKASLTVIDGHGATAVMKLRNVLGDVDVDSLTFTNGQSGEPGAGLQINYLITVNASVDIQTVIVSNNHSTVDGGGLFASGAGFEVNVLNSLFADNSADGNYGAGFLGSYASYSQFVSCTVTRNTTPTGAGAIGGFYFGGSDSWLLLNNIFWANMNTGIYLAGPPSTLVYNDRGALAGVTPLNILGDASINPQFVDPDGGDFHLGADSPLHGFSPDNHGGIDLDGHATPHGGQVDIGPYQDTIFADDLDAHST
jgi:hypothetical protein